MSIRIILVDYQNMVREVIRYMLEEENGIEVVAEAVDGQTTVEMVRKLKPDIVIMDTTLPILNSIEATRQIKAEFPEIKVIALSENSAKWYVVRMFKAGASGYILKKDSFSELLRAINEATANKDYLSPSITDITLEDLMDYLSKADTSDYYELTEQECNILKLITEGKTIEQIAICLHMGKQTVKTYREQITNKLGIHTTADLIKFAVQEGLITI